MNGLTVKDYIEILIFIVVIVSALITIVYGAVQGLRRARENARLRRQVDSDGAKRDEDSRVAPFKEAADGWEKAYRTQVVRVAELEKQVEELKRDRDQVKREHDQVVKLNLQLQGEMDSLRQRLTELEARLS